MSKCIHFEGRITQERCKINIIQTQATTVQQKSWITLQGQNYEKETSFLKTEFYRTLFSEIYLFMSWINNLVFGHR